MENLLFGPTHLNLNEKKMGYQFNLNSMTALEPYLPYNNNNDVYTLILDMDETLIHYFLVIFYY